MRQSQNFPNSFDYIELDRNTESSLTEFKTKLSLCSHFRLPAVESIILHLSWENVKTSFEFIDEFANSVFSYKNEGYRSVQYLKIIEKILLLPDTLQESRVKEFISVSFIKNFYSTLPKLTFFDQLRRVKENNCGFVMNVIIWWGELMKNNTILELCKRYEGTFAWIANESFWHGYHKLDFFAKGDNFDFVFEEVVKVFRKNIQSDEESSIEIEVRGPGMAADVHVIEKEDKGMETDEN